MTSSRLKIADLRWADHRLCRVYRPLVLVHCATSPAPDPDGVFQPSCCFVWFKVYESSLIPPYDMITCCDVFRNGRFEKFWTGCFSLWPCEIFWAFLSWSLPLQFYVHWVWFWTTGLFHRCTFWTSFCKEFHRWFQLFVENPFCPLDEPWCCGECHGAS